MLDEISRFYGEGYMGCLEETSEAIAKRDEAIKKEKKRLFLERYEKALSLTQRLQEEKSRIMTTDCPDPRDIPLTTEITKLARNQHEDEINLTNYDIEPCQRYGKPHLRFVATEITEQGIETIPLLRRGREILIPESLAGSLVKVTPDLYATRDVYSNDSNAVITLRIPTEVQQQQSTIINIPIENPQPALVI